MEIVTINDGKSQATVALSQVQGIRHAEVAQSLQPRWMVQLLIAGNWQTHEMFPCNDEGEAASRLIYEDIKSRWLAGKSFVVGHAKP